MSVIEFSGLVTGLDTNSWVSALTALKNAKVEELQTERAAVVDLKDVVSGIKSFFTSFRSSLEKLTDAKFGVDAMDIFVQNLANSSDPSKVTATASYTASRDTYEVGVTQLASATKVNTAIRKTFTMTYTADMDTKLTVLGAKEGYVSVNEKEIQIENSDTIESLINKLANIGITATYDEDKGRFTIETDLYEVDQGTTGVFDALGLEFKDITGTTSDELRVEGYVTIKPTTLLSDIGAVGGRITINQVVENLSFGAGATVQTFLDYMNNNYGAGTATMDADGYITISGVDIKEMDGGSNIITALGLTEKVDSVLSSSGNLSYVKTESADFNTRLGNLSTTFSDYRLILGNGSSTTTVNLSSTSTLNDVKSQIESYAAANGMDADVEIDEDGVLTITGDIDKLYITGGIATGLGLETDKVNGTSLTSSYLEYSLTYTAKTSTTFGDLGISGTNLTYTVQNERGENLAANLQVTSTTTIEQWFDSMKQYGISASISEEGGISIDGGLVTGNLANALGLNSVVSGSVIAETSAESNPLAGTTTTQATMTSSLRSLGITSNQTLTINVGGTNTVRNFTASSTLQDVADAIAAAGGEMTVEDGQLSITGVDKLTGSLVSSLDLDEHTIQGTSMYNRNLAYTVTSIATEATQLSSLGISGSNLSFAVYDDEGNLKGNVNLASTSTIGDLFTRLETYGINASIDENGVITLEGGYMTGGLANSLGLSHSVDHTYVSKTTIQSNALRGTITTVATMTSTLQSLGITSSQYLTIMQQGSTFVHTFTTASTLQSVADAITAAGGTFSFENKQITISGVGSISGSLLTGLGLAASATGNATTIYSTGVNYTVGSIATEGSKFSDFGISPSGRSFNVYSQDGTLIASNVTLGVNATIGDMVASLASYGLEAYVDSSGSINISNGYITGTMATALGISSRAYKTNVISVTSVSDLIYANVSTVATLQTTLSQLGYSGTKYLTINHDGTTSRYTFTASSTLSSISDAVKSAGGTFELIDGAVAISGVQISGSLATDLGIDYKAGGFTYTTETKTQITTRTINSIPTAIEQVITTITTTLTHTDTYVYRSAPKTYTTSSTEFDPTTTRLSQMGITNGTVNLYNGETGTTSAVFTVSATSTLSDFMAALELKGVTAKYADGRLTLTADEDLRVQAGTSNLVSHLGLNDNIYSNTYYGTTLVLEEDVNVATEETLVSYYDEAGKTAEGSVYLSMYDQDGNLTNAVINIEADDTIGSLIEKFEAVGLTAYFENGHFSYHNGMGTVEITGGTSAIADTLKLGDAVLEQWMQNDVEITYEQDEIRYLSVVNYADNSTTLETLGVKDGEFTLGINGAMVNINVASTDTLANVMSRISTASNGSVTASLTSDGKFMLQAAEGVELIIGTSTDTTNLVTIFNLSQDGSNVITGNTSLYKASSNTRLMESGIFREGNITEGTFTIGNAEFTITSETTIASLINEINHSEDANANAYWDNINGKMIITSTSLGASYVNIQGGTSNFTEIFGLTIDEPAGGGERLTTYNQELGDNAILTINGTRIVATSNTITSDISRIEGLTVNIKGLTEGEYVTITVERDTQSIIDAVQETLDAYNTLVAELNTVLAIGGDLHSDTALKSLKNQITSMFTSRGTNGVTQFRNLAAIGISTESASSAMPSDIYSLYLDADKFENALNTSEDEVKLLLVGTEDNPGILTRVETIVENMLATTGYFSTKTKSLDREISQYDAKIEKAQAQADSYKAMLENKFQNMELLYSQMQSAYTNVFSGGLV